MEAHCGNRRGHEQRQQPGAHPLCPDTHPGPQPAAQALQGGPIHPTKGLWLLTVWAGEGPGGHCRQSLRGELWALQPTDPKSTSEGLRHLVFPVFFFPLPEGDPVPSQSLARSPAPRCSGEPQKGRGGDEGPHHQAWKGAAEGLHGRGGQRAPLLTRQDRLRGQGPPGEDHLPRAQYGITAEESDSDFPLQNLQGQQDGATAMHALSALVCFSMS